MQYSRDAHYLPIQPVTLAEVKAHFPDEYKKYGVELGRAKVDEIDAHPHEVAHMIEQADAHGVTTRHVRSLCFPPMQIQGRSMR